MTLPSVRPFSSPPRPALLALGLSLALIACEDSPGWTTRDLAAADGSLSDGAAPDRSPSADLGFSDIARRDLAPPDQLRPDAAGACPNPTAPGRMHKSIEHLRDQALKNALIPLTKPQKCPGAGVCPCAPLSYDKARDALLKAGEGLLPSSGAVLECIYTGATTVPDGTRLPGGFNTEHSWPNKKERSRGWDQLPSNEQKCPKSDLHHLFPTEGKANSYRGNHHFAAMPAGTNPAWAQGGSKLWHGQTPGGDPTSYFEARLAYCGNVARANFYMAVRYGLTIDAKEEAYLRHCNSADPPDAAEKARNDAIERLQTNRNPFIDRPDFICKIKDF